MRHRYYNIRIVGPSPATCYGILNSTALHVVRKLDECQYRIRTAHLYKEDVYELFERCANQEGYPNTIVEIDAKMPEGELMSMV